MSGPACNHCDGLTRSRFLHRAAEAGRGLPAIEAGMPLPAGTGLTRRSFVAQGLGALLAVYGGGRLGLRALEEGIAAAAGLAPQPVLVSVFLEGGADALSVLSPQGDPLYRKLRPKLALAGGARRWARTIACTGIPRSPGSHSSTARRR